MKLYLAGLDTTSDRYDDIMHHSKYILVSYWYIRSSKNKTLINLLKKRNTEGRLILDSGAFTFFSSKSKLNISEYLDGYIEFINKYDIQVFAELDIDSVIGYEKTMQLRERLEKETSKQCLPVWHKSRGLQAFKDDVDKYPHVSIGGIVTGEIKRKEYDIFKQLTRYANARGVKVHGLGFTGKDCYKYGFDSVDSTSWKSGGRFASGYKFSNNQLKTIKRPEGTRLTDPLTIDQNNFIEWIKFQRYVERFRLWCMKKATVIKNYRRRLYDCIYIMQ